MFKIVTTYLVASLGVFGQSVLKAGIKNSLDIAVLEQAKDVYYDKIVSLINGITIPDLEDGKGNYLRDNTFEVISRSDKTEFYTDVANNAVVLRNAKVSGKYRSKEFRYKEGLLVAKGSVEVDMNTVEIVAGLSFSTKTLEDGRIVPFVSSVDVKCNINRFDINIKMHGNIWTDLASLFEVFFVGTVAGLIEDTIKLTIETGIPLAINTVVKATDGYMIVPPKLNWIIDYETPEAAIVTDSQF